MGLFTFLKTPSGIFTGVIVLATIGIVISLIVVEVMKSTDITNVAEVSESSNGVTTIVNETGADVSISPSSGSIALTLVTGNDVTVNSVFNLVFYKDTSAYYIRGDEIISINSAYDNKVYFQFEHAISPKTNGVYSFGDVVRIKKVNSITHEFIGYLISADETNEYDPIMSSGSQPFSAIPYIITNSTSSGTNLKENGLFVLKVDSTLGDPIIWAAIPDGQNGHFIGHKKTSGETAEFLSLEIV
jgi:hypothetical protein